MVRGINKQIIEIKCTNNECFEKILLFVKSDNSNLTNDVLKEKSRKYYNSIAKSYVRIPFYKQRKTWVIVFAMMTGIIAFLFAWLLL